MASSTKDLKQTNNSPQRFIETDEEKLWQAHAIKLKSAIAPTLSPVNENPYFLQLDDDKQNDKQKLHEANKLERAHFSAFFRKKNKDGKSFEFKDYVEYAPDFALAFKSKIFKQIDSSFLPEELKTLRLKIKQLRENLPDNVIVKEIKNYDDRIAVCEDISKKLLEQKDHYTQAVQNGKVLTVAPFPSIQVDVKQFAIEEKISTDLLDNLTFLETCQNKLGKYQVNWGDDDVTLEPIKTLCIFYSDNGNNIFFHDEKAEPIYNIRAFVEKEAKQIAEKEAKITLAREAFIAQNKDAKLPDRLKSLSEADKTILHPHQRIKMTMDDLYDVSDTDDLAESIKQDIQNYFKRLINDLKDKLKQLNERKAKLELLVKQIPEAIKELEQAKKQFEKEEQLALEQVKTREKRAKKKKRQRENQARKIAKANEIAQKNEVKATPTSKPLIPTSTFHSAPSERKLAPPTEPVKTHQPLFIDILKKTNWLNNVVLLSRIRALCNGIKIPSKEGKELYFAFFCAEHDCFFDPKNQYHRHGVLEPVLIYLADLKEKFLKGERTSEDTVKLVESLKKDILQAISSVTAWEDYPIFYELILTDFTNMERFSKDPKVLQLQISRDPLFHSMLIYYIYQNWDDTLKELQTCQQIPKGLQQAFLLLNQYNLVKELSDYFKNHDWYSIKNYIATYFQYLNIKLPSTVLNDILDRHIKKTTTLIVDQARVFQQSAAAKDTKEFPATAAATAGLGLFAKTIKDELNLGLGRLFRNAAGKPDSEVSLADFKYMLVKVKNESLLNTFGPNDKVTALYFAIFKKQYKKAQLLLEEKEIDVTIKCGRNPSTQLTAFQLLNSQNLEDPDARIVLDLLLKRMGNTLELGAAAFPSLKPN